MYARILVPIDGSDTAGQGLREAIALATALQSVLVLLHVVNDLPMLVDMSSVLHAADFQQDVLEHGEKLLASGRGEADHAGVRTEAVLTELMSGRVGQLIAREAQARNCQLIVMGTHGRRGLSRLAMGSDAELVLHHAAVPVLLVRHQHLKP
ncbi:universal stress protein [Azohydromonas aeria]|uniref:universal stress protein n=1 Tax=Azohydromonas aeria TaxID=2590212 RepID=UPI0012F86079|nr:universal stress protein [Azohydromonas aeria]